MNISNETAKIKAKSILESAWEMIDTPEKHCTGAFAVDLGGYSCKLLAPEARRWCALGALYTVMGLERIPLYLDTDPSSVNPLVIQALEHASYSLYNRGVAAVNDGMGYDAIRLLYQHAIENMGRD